MGSINMSAIIPKVTKLSPLVTRVLGCNPRPMTLQGTNTYLVGAGKRRILLDAGEPNVPEYIENLHKTLIKESCEVSDILVTHWHPDHMGGVPDVLRIVDNQPKVHKMLRLDGPETDIGSVDLVEVVDGQQFDIEGCTLRVVFTPGHSTDHFSLHLQEENVLFCGDCILGEGTTTFEDLHSYMASLEKILALAPSKLYPAHGPVILDPLPKIRFYIEHRLEREAQILSTLQKSNSPLTPMQLVKSIYKDTPEVLHKKAADNVGHHLSKLRKDGKVEDQKGTWTIK